jgi:hypothetical protein
MISDPALRARLVPNLEAREKGAEVAVAIASAAVRTRWNPESGIFRLLAGLGGNTRAERDLSERYLIHDERPIITELLRRALARERRRDVLGELRRIVDVRADIQAKRPIEK